MIGNRKFDLCLPIGNLLVVSKERILQRFFASPPKKFLRDCEAA